VALALAAGLALRLWMMWKFFEVSGDSLIYGGLAKNLLLHRGFALTTQVGKTYPTLIRLPGYPLFLAACFRVFGMENYASAAWVQIALELLGCLLLADFVRRIASPGAAHATLWLAALCPFTAIYSAEPLSEAPTLFLLALALWAAGRFESKPGWPSALGFTFAVSYAALLRPDGALAAVALAPALLMGLLRDRMREARNELGSQGNATALKGHDFRRAVNATSKTGALAPEGRPSDSSLTNIRFPAAPSTAKGRRIAEDPSPQGPKPAFYYQRFMARLKSCSDASCRAEGVFPQPVKSRPDAGPSSSTACKTPKLARMAVVCVLLALIPFAAWSWRNWRVFHVFEPLAPRLAMDPGEDQHLGWERWVKTWCLDFVSTYDVYWNVPGDRLDMTKLPGRAFDSPAEYAETAALAADYNRSELLTPRIDERFARLAAARIAAHPLRFYLWLPLGRVADMWLRPRIENLPIDLDWWVYSHHNVETRISWAYAGLNALYLLLGIAGLCLRPRFWPWMLAYMALRSAMLLSVAAPEARYTLECFPMLFVLGGMALGAGWRRLARLKKKG
jgi:hypothetical protein